MASSSSQPPVGSDAPSNPGTPWNQARSSRFEWVSPSPSPAVVAELERLFPDIIQVPVLSLEAEIAKWKDCAIFARSLARWIPPEALVRELHRAGVSGKIDAVALAHRHYLLRFDDAQATEFILRRPWVVNGQPIAMAEWQQEFVPGESTLLQSLLWIRLPLLPIEFWSDDALSSILSVAGEFMYADDSTRDRDRGGFARACVRVDLSKPLRPGARIRGSGNPFWQQFAYEHIDGVCRSCGSLHLSGECGSSSAGSSSNAGFQFGPWLTALRRRKTPVEQRVNPQQSSDSGKPPPSSSVPLDEWQLPKKVARRNRSRGSLSLGVFSSSGGSLDPLPSSPKFGSEVEGHACRSASPVPVVGGDSPVSSEQPRGTSRKSKVVNERSGPLTPSPLTGNAACRSGGHCVPVAVKSGSLALQRGSLVSVPVETLNLGSSGNNPFVDGSLTEWARVPKSCGAGMSGQSKRARPVEPVSQRTVSKASKAKGKASLRGKANAMGSFTFSAQPESPRGMEGLAGIRESKSRRKDKLVPESPQLVQVAGSEHDVAVARLKNAILKEGIDEDMDSSRMDEHCAQGAESPLVSNVHTVEQVSEDRVGVPISPV